MFNAVNGKWAGCLIATMLALAACGKPVVDEVPVLVEPARAATVNDEPIYVSDVELEAVARGIVEAGTRFDKSHEQYGVVLDQLIDQKLMAQEALARNLADDPAAERRLQMARERILGNLLVESLVAREVTEESIEKMYEEQVALQQSNDEVSIAHILVTTETEARVLRDRIDAGESFESLVSSHSQDTATRMEKGDLGFVSPNLQPDPVPLVIANTAVGEVSQPFESADGWHLLKVKARRTSPPKTRAQMRPDIVTFLTLNEISRILRRLRTEADIQEGASGSDLAPSNPVRLPDASTPEPTEPDLPPPAKEGSEL